MPPQATILYETVLIFKPALSDAEVGSLMEKTKAAIAKDGGEVVSHEIWGRRKLTHMIGKAREGVYGYFKYRSDAVVQKKMAHQFSLDSAVMRYKTVRAVERPLGAKPRKEKAASGGPQPSAPSAQPS